MNTITTGQSSGKPFRMGIAGLTHTHVHGILARAKDGDIEITGIAESDVSLAHRYLDQYGLPRTLLYPTLTEMLSKTKPDAVAAFGSIYEHLAVVEACAPAKIHVMVEKPLAVNMDHARRMKALADKHGIVLLTNYETTWYESNQQLEANFIRGASLGKIRKMVIHDGHMGPKEIGVNEEFLRWLTDPVQNGGGAVTDFGCYGANLSTWLLQGQRPLTVTAVLQQLKPEVYSQVDDEATIVLTYPGSQSIIQASWNWPYHRKDIEVYAEKGYVIADKSGAVMRTSADEKEVAMERKALARPFHDPFAYLAAVVRGEVRVKSYDLSSLENNMLVVEILDAARQSAKEGRTITLKSNR